MQHWLQLATSNWRAKPLRTLAALLAIALGVGAVVWVTCCYESVRRATADWGASYVGKSQINIQSPLGRYDTLPQRLARKIEQLEGVERVTPLLVQRLPAAVYRSPDTPEGRADRVAGRYWSNQLDVHGIDLEREPAIRDWSRMLVAGRLLTPEDDNACVLEASIAREAGVGLGDRVMLYRGTGAPESATELEIVGLIERRRIARFLKGVALVRLPVLQRIAAKHALLTSIDVVLAEKDERSVVNAAARIRAALRGDAPTAQVRSAAARLSQVSRAQDQQEVVLVLLSCVAMLTALFIILSTLSMGLVERVAQMGLLRCVGTTRAQLATLTLAEVLPLGVVGIAAGVPIGLGLTLLTVQLVPQYVGTFAVSWRGVMLACIAGLATTLVAAVLPALAAARVSPLEATRPRARLPHPALMAVPLLVAIAALALQWYVVTERVRRDMDFVQWAATAVVLLYVGYAAAAPVAVWLVSRLAVPLVAALLRVRLSLLQDQVGRAVWRSAGICCGLMVGLSLIVGLVVVSESFKSGWQFPRQFPEGYIWSYEQIEGDAAAVIASTPGVRNFTVANAVNVVVEERPLLMEQVLLSVTWFLGTEPDSFLDLVRLEFIPGQGDEATARRLLRQGGYVLVAADFARTRRKGIEEVRDENGNIVVSNRVRVWFNDRWTEFKVAGVIDSPALDIAAGYFQLESEAYVVASGSVIGTNADLKRLFNVDGARMVLLNFNLPDTPPPPDWQPPGSDSPLGKPTDDLLNATLPRESRWRYYQEAQLLQDLKMKLGAHQAFWGTARELKDQIDRELTQLTYLLTAVPAVALLVAAIGVANLMTANVAARTRPIAILRAVGATRGLIARLIIGEALVLGVLGSGLGLALGMHLAVNTTAMTAQMWGLQAPFIVPWPLVSAAVALTISLCIIAGLAPARHASRTNVIDALRVA